MAMFAGAMAPASPTNGGALELRSGGPHASAPVGVINSARAAALERAAWMSAGRNAWRSGAYPRPGYSVRQGQRMAAKRRNRARHRRAARG